MKNRLIWLGFIPIYLFLFLILIPYTDAGDIETHISRINESATVYYDYIGFLINFGDSNLPLVNENGYRVYLGSYREYGVSLTRLYVFIFNLPFLVIYVILVTILLKNGYNIKS